MDIVITYVNGLDPVWQKDYHKYTNVPILEKRFRDWGTLKFLFRGIETHMPFVNNVFLVVSHPSQIPDWVNQDKVRVVLHKDFVPHEHLPTFNCNTLEVNLHRIKDLGEEFLYFNDDMFPVMDCEHSDFFKDGKVRIGFSRHYMVSGMHKRHCKNSDSLARKVLGLPKSIGFIRPQHICTPLLRSESEKLAGIVADDISRVYARIREGYSYNQYLFIDYLYYQNKAINERVSSRHLSVAISSASKICSAIVRPKSKIICINDARISQERYERLRDEVITAFGKHFPDKSGYEL